MKISELFSGYRDFNSESQIRHCIIDSKNFNSEKEDPDKANVLLIFETTNQKTWLIATNFRLYCILDDIRKSIPHINWSIGKNNLLADNKVILDIKCRDKTKNTGLVDLGDKHKNWLYSKRLFPNYNVEDAIKNLIFNSMLDAY